MRLKTALFVVGIFILASSVVFALTRLGRDDQPRTPFIRTGNALSVGRHWKVTAPLAVGQEVVDMFGSIKNTSDVAIELQEIRPVRGDGVPENGRVVDVFLVPFRFQPTVYNTLPPVMRVRGKCKTATITSLAGHVLEPGEEVLVAMHVRATRAGTFSLEERDIIYEQSGRRYRQRDPYFFTGKVRPGHKRKLLPEERACRDETTILPT